MHMTKEACSEMDARVGCAPARATAIPILNVCLVWYVSNGSPTRRSPDVRETPYLVGTTVSSSRVEYE